MQDALNKLLTWPKFYTKIESDEQYNIIVSALIDAGYLWWKAYITGANGAFFNKLYPLLIVDTRERYMLRASPGPDLANGESCEASGRYVSVAEMLEYVATAQREVAAAQEKFAVKTILNFARNKNRSLLLRPKI